MERRVVVTGCGVIAPNGVGTEEFWAACLAGEAVVAAIPEAWSRYAGGRVRSSIYSPLPEIDFTQFNISRVEKLQMAFSTMLTISAAAMALDQAGLAIDLADPKKNSFVVPGLDRQRTGVYMGTGVGGYVTQITNAAGYFLAPVKSAWEEIAANAPAEVREAEAVARLAPMLERVPRMNPFVVAMLMPNACAGALSLKYSLNGPSNTFASACASGTVAIGKAFRAIRGGEVEVALSGGVEYLGDDYGLAFRGFDIANTLAVPGDDPLTANCPFDQNRSGFLFSDGGCGVLVLEELEHARARGAAVIAEISGFAESSDAYSMMDIDPAGSQISRMIDMALAEAGLARGDIDYVNAHATGTAVNDKIEAKVLEEMFGRGPVVNATKSLIGHTIGASGAIEAVVSALSIRDRTTHVCKNLREPITDQLSFVTERQELPIRKAISNSFAFGGHNAVLVLEEIEP